MTDRSRTPRPSSARRVRASMALAWLALCGTAPVAAQNVVLDEGTFRISLQGRDVGTETFAIRRVGQGPEAHVIANADIVLDLPGGPESVKPLLQTDAAMGLGAYQLEVSGKAPLEIAVTSVGRRLLARSRSPAGEQEREYRAVPGGVVLDEGVAHHYWFLGSAVEGTVVSALVPRTGTQERVEVRSVRPGTVRVGGTDVQARQVTLAVAGAVREVWYDSDGHVLRVDVPAAGYRAERADR